MLGLPDLSSIDEQQLPADVALALQVMRRHIERQAGELHDKTREIETKSREIAWRDARLEKLQLELARLKRWKFDARSEAMTAQQRVLFAETLAEDEADLQAQLAALRALALSPSEAPKDAPRRPRRQALPEHLQRAEHRHEPADTNCPNADCGQPMQRVGEDISEKLDIIPAQFFVHRHIYGKWACRCCQQLVQEPAEPDVVDGGIPASGLVAYTLISRFADHLPYYRQEAINARAGVHTPRSTLAA
jgi:transposase